MSATDNLKTVAETPGLICLWTFQEDGIRRANAGQPYLLTEQNGRVPRTVSALPGPFGIYAARFAPETGSLLAPRASCPTLDLHGPKANVSVIAWIWRERAPASLEKSCQAVAGMWNEHGKRQYCLFLNLRIHNSAEQVGAHVSAIGGPTPGFKYCMDAAIGATPTSFGRWQCVAMTYDGLQAKAYLNGQLDSRGDRNPYRYEGGLFNGGKEGADFTVGAVTRPKTVTDDGHEQGTIVANRFFGLLGGLAIFNRALTSSEVTRLAQLQ